MIGKLGRGIVNGARREKVGLLGGSDKARGRNPAGE